MSDFYTLCRERFSLDFIYQQEAGDPTNLSYGEDAIEAILDCLNEDEEIECEVMTRYLRRYADHISNQADGLSELSQDNPRQLAEYQTWRDMANKFREVADEIDRLTVDN